MPTLENLFFDLDGTLIDSADGIINGLIYAFEKLGGAIPERKELYRFIGPPLDVSFKTFYSMSDKTAERAIRFYREYYSEKGVFEFSVYDGVEKMLANLYNSGKKLYLATSKPEVFAKQILKKAGLDVYFTAVVGSLIPSGRDSKSEVIGYLLENYDIDPKKTVMIGDRFYDVVGAHKLSLPAIGVLYGFGDRAEMEEYSAEAVAQTPDDVTDIILNGAF